MTEAVIVGFNAVGALAFLVAFLVAIRIPARRDGLASPGVRMLIAAAAAVYLFVSVSNMLEHGIGYEAVDVVEDYSEVFFVPLLAYTAYALRSRQQYLDEARRARMARRQHDFLLQVIDVSPVGLLVVDDIGGVTFASEGARAALDIGEAAGSVTLPHPAWRVRDPAGEPLERGFASLCPRRAAVEDVPLVLEWPDGATASLLVSAAPMADRTGRLGGYVVALEDVSARRAVLGA
ncbi:MAG: PAS domain-containing protein [Coriobacteriia bacterium]|nr:PAS domain-containing protein [Coriobacteriia bacterium]